MKYVLKIDGMSCKNCVKHVTEALLKTTGVTACTVNLKNKSATVETNKEFTKGEFEDIIDEAGYELMELNI